jgi:hypothetical protein
MLYTSSGTRQAADSNDDSNGASQPLPRTHDNIQPRSGLISRTGRPLRLKNGRSRVAPTPLRSLPRVGISDSFLTDWPDGTGLWHLYRTPIRGDRRHACRHLPLPTTVRLLQVRVEPERGWLLQRR